MYQWRYNLLKAGSKYYQVQQYVDTTAKLLLLVFCFFLITNFY